MMADLDGLRPGDVAAAARLLPQPDRGQPRRSRSGGELTDFVLARGAVPLIDLAYQGFGDGLEEDVGGAAHMAAAVPEMMLAASCSKNFGVYRDRVGAAFVLSATRRRQRSRASNLASLNRLNYLLPAGPWGEGVSIVLADPALKADWAAELEEMRAGMLEPAHRPRRGAPARDELGPLRLRRGAPRHVLAARLSAPSRWRRCARTTASTWSATAG